MIGKGLRYGLLSSTRRIRSMILPIVTTATGAFLVVVVFAMAKGIRDQASVIGHVDAMGRALVLISITVLLVGVVEVAVATTRTVAVRTREIGVLGATGVRRAPVVAALLVEPMVVAVIGAILGAVLAAALCGVLAALGAAASGISVTGMLTGIALALGVSIVAALLTSIAPTWNAASRPPIRSLSG